MSQSIITRTTLATLAALGLAAALPQAVRAQGYALTTLSGPAGASSASALGINSSGTVVGSYTDASGTHTFFGTPAPEPPASADLALGVLGLAGLILKARRRTASAV